MTASFPYLGDGCTNCNVCVLGIFPALQALHSATRTCRSSLSLSQLGRAVRGGCALLLPNVKRINMIRGERVF